MKDPYKVFCTEFCKAVNQLGLKHIRFTLHKGMSPNAPQLGYEELKCAGLSEFYPEAQVCDVWYDPASNEEPKYIAWHEASEVLLMQLRFLMLECVRKRKFDENKWDELSHEVINRICSSHGMNPKIEF